MEPFEIAAGTASHVSIPTVSLPLQYQDDALRRENITLKDIQMKPWKYIGYRGYSTFLASDTDFFILRRFARANSLVALALQDQVSETIEELERLDVQSSRKETGDIDNGSFRNNTKEHRDLLEELHSRLTKYSESVSFA